MYTYTAAYMSSNLNFIKPSEIAVSNVWLTYGSSTYVILAGALQSVQSWHVAIQVASGEIL